LEAAQRFFLKAAGRMLMHFTTFKAEQNLTELVQRLFQTKGADATTLPKEAEAALLRANPQLRNLKKVPEGGLLIVPTVPGVEPTAEVLSVAAAPGDLVAEVNRAVVSVRRALLDSLYRQEEEANTERGLVKAPELQAVLERNPELQKRLAQVAQAAKGRMREAKDRRAAYEEAFAQLEKDLGSLVKVLA
jgi:hypothetical protein